MALLTVEIQGRTKKWGFNFEGDPAHLDDWLADGLDVGEITEVTPVDDATIAAMVSNGGTHGIS